MPNPTRITTAGRIYNDLRNLAKRSRRSTDELMIEYVLGRFLYRVAVSPLGGRHLILKGGLLLAQFLPTAPLHGELPDLRLPSGYCHSRETLHRSCPW